VVWVGYDDNRAARLSGAASALPVWGEMMAPLSPEPLVLPAPDGIEMVSIDVQSGLRGGPSCAGSLELPFMKGSAPDARAPCSGTADAVVEAVGEAVKPVKSWLDRLLGR
jgi:penicillin-binding protein 1B